ncbi:MAG: glycerophosphodiester phosphodiesterase family protein [Calditrichaeota bacterium]|nr:glycerophosphodiester phosphodiesterase family protein [Calditrichota bacterium]HQU70820.1 glycerophosphodiester phosphodiesterase family protein [Calditrichia bacterium]
MTRFSKLWLAALLLAALLPACQKQNDSSFSPVPYLRNFSSVAELSDYLAWKPGRPALLSAHRGGPLPGYPENAIETFENILHYAPALIECDVRKTRDDALVMLHDEELDRTTTGKGLLAEHSLDEVSGLFLVDNEGRQTDYRIPTLDAVLEWARGKAVLTLDVKRGVSAEEVAEAIRRHEAQPYAVVITYTLEWAERFHQLDPDLMISASAKGPEGVARLLNSGIPANRLVAFVGVSEPDPAVYQELHNAGISTILGTMGNLDTRAAQRGISVYQSLIQNGATILSTDNVPLATRALH